MGYMSAALAQQDIGRFLMERYNWRRPHQSMKAWRLPLPGEKLNSVIRDQLTTTHPLKTEAMNPDHR